MKKSLKKTVLLIGGCWIGTAVFGNGLAGRWKTNGFYDAATAFGKCGYNAPVGGGFTASYTGMNAFVELDSLQNIVLSVPKTTMPDFGGDEPVRRCQFETNMFLRLTVMEQLGLDNRRQYFVPRGSYAITSDARCYYVTAPLQFVEKPASRFSITLNSDP